MNPTGPSQPQDEYEWELIAGDVLGDLSEDEQAKFESLQLERCTDANDGLAQTAAALHLVFEKPDMESMPNRLRAKILADAPAHLTSAESGDAIESRTLHDGERVTRSTSELTSPGVGRRAMAAWLVFAASLVAAIAIWNQGEPKTLTALTLNEARAELVRKAEDLLQVEWGEGKTPFAESVGGDVVWSNAAQSGFMRFVGLPVNDPQIEQYQLWIIDPQRDDEPIDGGVFDVRSVGETIVEIDAKLAVIEPAAFAITIEKPGGVVVSTQDRLPLIAAVK